MGLAEGPFDAAAYKSLNKAFHEAGTVHVGE